MKELTGCDGVMIARGSHGAPWLFRQSRAALDGDPVPGEPDVRTRFEICIRHAENAVAFEGNADKAVREFRKHLGWYTKGLADGRRLRQRLFQVLDLREVRSVLEGYLARNHFEGFAQRQGDLILTGARTGAERDLRATVRS